MEEWSLPVPVAAVSSTPLRLAAALLALALLASIFFFFRGRSTRATSQD